ncbi:MAG: adenylate kinase [Oscillospiraceae bacterium]
MKIILLGAPGAGKGTQAQMICEKYQIPQISTGDIIREALSNGSEVGQKAKSFIEKGALVPDEVVIEMVRQRLSQADCNNGFVLDGFPRTIPQADALEEMGVSIDNVVEITVAEEEIVKRISGRRTCKHCGASYHTEFKPSAKGDICEKCDTPLVIRKDDNPESVKTRLEEYRSKTQPLKDYYEKKGKLTVIQGIGDINDIFNAIVKALEA